MNVFMTIPSFLDKGGVSSYYCSVLPFLTDEGHYKMSYLEIGSGNASYKLLHPLIDQIRFYKSISNHNFDLIHVNPSLNRKSFLRDGMFIYIAKRKRLPVLVFFHGWDKSFESQVEERFTWFFKKTYLKSDHFIVLASAFKEKLRKWGVKVPVYIGSTAVDNGLLMGFSIENKINILRNASEIKVLFLSRVEKKKGVFVTLEALNILFKRGHAVSLSIAGDGAAMREVRGYLARHKLYTKIKLLGYVKGEKKKEVFSSHHVFCFPSSYGEGMPNCLLEAMSFGMPIVTRPVGGIKDFFENGKMGYLTESKDPQVIADLLEQLIEDKKKMIDIALYNHFYAKENFMASKVGKKLGDIYQNIFMASNTEM